MSSGAVHLRLPKRQRVVIVGAGASGVDVRLIKALRDCQRATASHVRFVKVEHGTCRLSTKRDPLAPVLWDTRPPSVLARWREQAQRNHSPSANRLLPVRQTNSITPDRLVSWRQQAMKGGSLTPSEWPGPGHTGSGSRPGSAKVRDGEGKKKRPQTAGPSRNGIRGLAGGVGMAQRAAQQQITTMEPNPASPDGMGQRHRCASPACHSSPIATLVCTCVRACLSLSLAVFSLSGTHAHGVNRARWGLAVAATARRIDNHPE